MLQIIVCEDNKEQAAYLETFLKELNLPEFECKIYHDGNHLLQELQSLSNCSIFLMDIMMPEITGIHLAKQINEVLPQSPIIYITAYLNTVTDVQDTQHCYFILKQEMDKRLPIALNKALDTLKNNSKTILVSKGSEKVVVHLHDIYYLERVKRYTFIHLEDKTLRVSETLSQLLILLPNSFERTHNSFIINFNKVEAMRKDLFELTNTEVVPISRNYRKDCEKAFYSYIMQIL